MKEETSVVLEGTGKVAQATFTRELSVDYGVMPWSARNARSSG